MLSLDSQLVTIKSNIDCNSLAFNELQRLFGGIFTFMYFRGNPRNSVLLSTYPCGNLIGTVTPIYRLDTRKEACREYGKNSGEKEITRKSNRIARKEIEAKGEANWSNRRNN